MSSGQVTLCEFLNKSSRILCKKISEQNRSKINAYVKKQKQLKKINFGKIIARKLNNFERLYCACFRCVSWTQSRAQNYPTTAVATVTMNTESVLTRCGEKDHHLSNSDDDDEIAAVEVHHHPAISCGQTRKESGESDDERDQQPKLTEMTGISNTQAIWDEIADRVETEAAKKNNNRKRVSFTKSPNKKRVSPMPVTKPAKKVKQTPTADEQRLKQISQWEAQPENLLNVLLLMWETNITMSVLLPLMINLGRAALRAGDVALKRQVLTWREGLQEVKEKIEEKGIPLRKVSFPVFRRYLCELGSYTMFIRDRLSDTTTKQLFQEYEKLVSPEASTHCRTPRPLARRPRLPIPIQSMSMCTNQKVRRALRSTIRMTVYSERRMFHPISPQYNRVSAQRSTANQSHTNRTECRKKPT